MRVFMRHEPDRPKKPWRLDWREGGKRRTKRFATKREAKRYRQALFGNEPIPNPTQVYVIAGAGLFKVGLAIEPSRRLGQLQANSPVPLMIARTWRAPRAVERALHQGFSSFREHGEWFRLPDGWEWHADRIAHAADPTARQRWVAATQRHFGGGE